MAPDALRQAVGGGCGSGWGRLLSVTNAIEAGIWDSGWEGLEGGGVSTASLVGRLKLKGRWAHSHLQQWIRCVTGPRPTRWEPCVSKGVAGSQRVGMCSGERPIGAAKGTRPNTEASCQTPPLCSAVQRSAATCWSTRALQPQRSTCLRGACLVHSLSSTNTAV